MSGIPHNKRKHLSEADKQDIINKLKNDWSVNKIKNEYGVGCSKIIKIIKDKNISYDSKKKQNHKGKITQASLDIFCKNSLASNCRINKFIRTHNIIDHENCYKCGISEWLDQKLNLDLDHINGNNLDNRIENLRFLCPNCHSQTPTFKRSSYRGKQKVNNKEFIEALKEEPTIHRALRRIGLTPKGGNYERAYKLKNLYNI